MNKVKVCHFTSAHKSNDIRVFQKECVSLAKEGYEVYLVAPNTKSKVVNGINIVGVSVKSMNPIYRLMVSAKKIYQAALRINADIYHFHDIELFKYGVKLKQKGYKVIFDSHENWIGYTEEISWLPTAVKKISAGIIKRNYRKHLKDFDAVITVSPHIAEMLGNYSSKVWIVSNYPFVKETKTILREDFINRDNKICYAGTVYSNSNQETIINAINKISSIEYVIVGTISNELRTKLESLSGWEKVKFIEKVPKSELHNIFNSSIAGIIIFDYSPNCGGKKGTMGNNKIFEYMEAGLPIICTDFETWKNNIIDKYNCGIYVEPGNQEQLKNAIITLISNHEKAYRMGLNGQKAVLNEFNWGTQEKILLDIYKKI